MNIKNWTIAILSMILTGGLFGGLTVLGEHLPHHRETITIVPKTPLSIVGWYVVLTMMFVIPYEGISWTLHKLVKKYADEKGEDEKGGGNRWE